MSLNDPDIRHRGDETLAKLAQAGCVASFEELARRYQVPLLHFLQQRLAAADAEDTLQETLLRAYQRLDRYDEQWPFAAWIYTITRRLCLNRLRDDATRRRLLQAAYEQSAGARPPAVDPAEAAQRADRRDRVWAIARDRLSEREFTALWLKYAEDMSLKDIGRVIESTPGAVKLLLFRARGNVRSALIEEAQDWHFRQEEPREAVAPSPLTLKVAT